MLFARRATIFLAFVALAAGCATGSRTAPRTDNASWATVVTHVDLARFGSQGTLMDALERLRPSMLGSRGTTPRVSVDGSPPAELSVLRTIAASAVLEVRMQRASSHVGQAAIAADGRVIVRDVIVVTMWPGALGRR